MEGTEFSYFFSVFSVVKMTESKSGEYIVTVTSFPISALSVTRKTPRRIGQPGSFEPGQVGGLLPGQVTRCFSG
jgi:hypothetical protein